LGDSFPDVDRCSPKKHVSKYRLEEETGIVIDNEPLGFLSGNEESDSL
jgi:hypothetical protein